MPVNVMIPDKPQQIMDYNILQIEFYHKCYQNESDKNIVLAFQIKNNKKKWNINIHNKSHVYCIKTNFVLFSLESADVYI